MPHYDRLLTGAAVLVLGGAALIAAATTPAPGSQGATARHIVVFVTDDHGQDTGAYGNPAVKTPNLDALAAEGVLFRHAYATTASCSASRSVILSGLQNHRTAQYGHEHDYSHFRSYDDLRTLPALLKGAGYRTARIGKYHVGPEEAYQFDEAFLATARVAPREYLPEEPTYSYRREDTGYIR